MKNQINYKVISDALEYYQSKGFEYLDVDWVCHNEIAKMTMQEGVEPLKLLNKTLVGSAEQSFLDQIVYHNLPPNRYVAASPCFRNENEDLIHSKYFFKVELIDFLNVTEESLLEIIQIAVAFFNKHTKVKIHQTNMYEYDILDEFTNIELGSYGIRKVGDLEWIYATGVAEPRLSYIKVCQS